MIASVVYFGVIGWAVARLFHARGPALAWLLGLAANGIALYLLGILHVPLAWPLNVAIAVVAALTIRRTKRDERIAHPKLATALLAIPCIVWIAAAAVLPIRDYDGRATWLPKARAIATEHAIDGAFFQGKEGLNLHNRYPLLMPLNAASVMMLSGDTSDDAARWLYVLIPIAALFAARDLLRDSWTIAAVAWLPLFAAVDGGALAAYSDCAVAAFGGIAVLCAMRGDTRVTALMLAALVLTKNEGALLAIAIVIAVAIARRRDAVPLGAAVIAAMALLAVWHLRIPAAYDEQYSVLVRDLPHRVNRVPAAIAAIARHAIDIRTWGLFWPAAAFAALCSKRMPIIPLTALLLALGGYVAAFTVTSWDINELAAVAANRLLLHMVIPACALIAGMGSRQAAAA